jgi:gluconokinase
MGVSSPAPARRFAVVVMGVSGSGKSTVGAGVADVLGLGFVDGDGLHSPESVARMAAGQALSDDDRWPWLDRIGARLADAHSAPAGLVIACSALKRIYRDRIRAAAPGVRFVFLDGPAEVIAARMAGRSGHYMPTALLASQLRTLEPPGADEIDALRFDIALPAPEIARRAAIALAGSPP